jgi:hypothetical protein
MGIENNTPETAESTDDDYEPIGVVLVANVIVHTDDHDEAQNAARGVVEELNGEMADGDIEVHMDTTNDHFEPEGYEKE